MAEKKNKNNIYPELVIKNNENPNRLLAFPLLGFLIKIILLIPLGIESIFLAFGFVFFWIVTPFVILFTGKYWDSAYNFFLGYFKFSTKISFYLYGLTDKYPGFGLDDNGIFSLKIDKPVAPSRAMAFPLLGFIARSIMLIPYSIFNSVLGYGSYVAVFVSWFAVIFTGKYPVSLYEFERDTLRVSLGQRVYSLYLSDSYPSFYMSMKNKTVKTLLIIAGTLLFILRVISALADESYRRSYEYRHTQYNYKNK